MSNALAEQVHSSSACELGVKRALPAEEVTLDAETSEGQGGRAPSQGRCRVTATSWQASKRVEATVVRRSWTGLNAWELNTKINPCSTFGAEWFTRTRSAWKSTAPRVRVRPTDLWQLLFDQNDGALREEEQLWTVLDSRESARGRPRSVAPIASTGLQVRAGISVCTFRAPCTVGRSMGGKEFAAILWKWRQRLTEAGCCKAILDFNEEEGEYTSWGMAGMASEHMYGNAATHVVCVEDDEQDSRRKFLAEATELDVEDINARGGAGGGLIAWVHANCDMFLEEFTQASSPIFTHVSQMNKNPVFGDVLSFPDTHAAGTVLYAAFARAWTRNAMANRCGWGGGKLSGWIKASHSSVFFDIPCVHFAGHRSRHCALSYGWSFQGMHVASPGTL